MDPYIVAVIVILVLGIAVLISTLFIKNKDEDTEKSSTTREYRGPADFKLYNYLPRHTVKVDVLVGGSTSSPVTLVDAIPPKGKKAITRALAGKYIVPGNILRFYTQRPGEKPELYADYSVDTSTHERVKALHIGMITSRYIGYANDKTNNALVAENSGLGQTWITIHNMTYRPLRMNHDRIYIDGHNTFMYKGQYSTGVPLGLILHDEEGMYPDFQYLQPQSDIYYGVVSDLQQPIFGPWQLEFSDDCDPSQTMWPMQLGYY